MKKLILVVFLLFLGKFCEYGNVNFKEYSSYELTMKNIEIHLKGAEIQHIDIVLNQIRLETGNLKFIKNNNLFGFRTNEYLKFDHWTEAIKYKKIWQDKYYKKGSYYTFLKKLPYAEDSNYIIKLKQFKNKKNG